MLAFVVAAVLKLSLLTRNDCSMKCMSLEGLEPLCVPKAKPDVGLPIGKLLLSDVAGPWLAAGLFALFCNFT